MGSGIKNFFNNRASDVIWNISCYAIGLTRSKFGKVNTKYIPFNNTEVLAGEGAWELASEVVVIFDSNDFGELFEKTRSQGA